MNSFFAMIADVRAIGCDVQVDCSFICDTAIPRDVKPIARRVLIMPPVSCNNEMANHVNTDRV